MSNYSKLKFLRDIGVCNLLLNGLLHTLPHFCISKTFIKGRDSLVVDKLTFHSDDKSSSPPVFHNITYKWRDYTSESEMIHAINRNCQIISSFIFLVCTLSIQKSVKIFTHVIRGTQGVVEPLREGLLRTPWLPITLQIR